MTRKELMRRKIKQPNLNINLLFAYIWFQLLLFNISINIYQIFQSDTKQSAHHFMISNN